MTETLSLDEGLSLLDDILEEANMAVSTEAIEEVEESSFSVIITGGF